MNRVFGGDVPATIWRDFISRAAAGAKIEPKAPRAAADSGLRGVPEVIDTGTLQIRGKIIRLLGIQGEAGRMSGQLARHLRRREVACEPVGGAEMHRCQLEGEDLSELILAGGGARARPDAPSELLAAEEQARSARLGVWRRSR